MSQLLGGSAVASTVWFGDCRIACRPPCLLKNVQRTITHARAADAGITNPKPLRKANARTATIAPPNSRADEISETPPNTTTGKSSIDVTRIKNPDRERKWRRPMSVPRNNPITTPPNIPVVDILHFHRTTRLTEAGPKTLDLKQRRYRGIRVHPFCSASFHSFDCSEVKQFSSTWKRPYQLAMRKIISVPSLQYIFPAKIEQSLHRQILDMAITKNNVPTSSVPCPHHSQIAVNLSTVTIRQTNLLSYRLIMNRIQLTPAIQSSPARSVVKIRRKDRIAHSDHVAWVHHLIFSNQPKVLRHNRTCACSAIPAQPKLFLPSPSSVFRLTY
jgi:hypothetical protein